MRVYHHEKIKDNQEQRETNIWNTIIVQTMHYNHNRL